MSENGLRIRQDGLVHDIVNGEAIVLNIGSGTYYNLTGSAAEIWAFLDSGASLEQIANALEARYGSGNSVRADVASFLEELVAEGLVCECAAGAGSLSPGLGQAGDWQKPELTAYDDLQDLLTIDPIHDVDDSGWPNAKRT